MKIFRKYGALTVVAVVTLVLGVFVPDAQLKRIIFGVGLIWFIASVLVERYGRKTSHYAKSKGFDHGDAEIFEDLMATFDDIDLIEKVPVAVLNYYRDKLKGTDFSFFEAGGREFPIIKKESWTPNPLEFPQGIYPELKLLKGRNNKINDNSAFGDIYIKAAREKGQLIEPNDLYALDKISEVDSSGVVTLEVKISDYDKFVRASQILNPELLLHLKRMSTTNNSVSASLAKKRFGLKLRDQIKVEEFGNYVCKIGLNILTVERNIDGDRFFIMKRENMNKVRPLEYPNANHVVPAGTVQPGALGKAFDSHEGDDDLSLKNTLYREFAEELFGEETVHQDRLKESHESGEVKFIITGMGIDAGSQKFEIAALLVTPDSYMTGFRSAKKEGSNQVVNRDELIKLATEVKKIIPAGAMAIFQGLKYLDSIPR